MSKIRVFLIEDNRLLRDGITHLINDRADMVVVEGSTGHESLLRKARAARPQVVLADLSGFRAAATLAKRIPGLKVIGMGLAPTQLDIVEFVQAGASGFIMKGATVEEFLETIRTVAQGGIVLPPLLTNSLFAHVVEHALKKGTGQSRSAIKLTGREREIVALIADSLSNREIAARLNIATYTVKSHVHNILEKLALHSRLQIVTNTRDDESL